MKQWKRKLTAVGMGALIGLVWGCTLWSRAEEDPAVRKEAGQQEQSDQEQQARILSEAVSQEKLEEYLDEHPEGSCEDERASFRINETLNEAAFGGHGIWLYGWKDSGRGNGRGIFGVSSPAQQPDLHGIVFAQLRGRSGGL